MLAIASQTTGPNWLTFFSRGFFPYLFLLHGQRRALINLSIKQSINQSINYCLKALLFEKDAPAFCVLKCTNVNEYISRRIPDFVYPSQIIIQIHGIQLGLYLQY